MKPTNPLFSDKYLNSKFQQLELLKIENLSQKLDIIRSWQKSIKNNAIIQSKEESLQGNFLQQFFVDVLNYSNQKDTGTWFLETEQKAADGKKMDGALGFFTINDKTIHADVRVVIELKNAKTDLDKPQTRKNDNRTPVQQAFDYANSLGGTCRWIIVSNFLEIRLYYQTDRTRYQVFDISTLDKEDKFKQFYFLLNKARLINQTGDSITDKLYSERQAEEIEISKKFYADYKQARLTFFQSLKAYNPTIDELILLTKTQKLLDRLLFIHFCEDYNIIDTYTLRNLIDSAKKDVWNRDHDKIYRRIVALFSAINEGYPELRINKFNGGLFADDEIFNNLLIDDAILKPVLALVDYDLASDLNVNILGHIFEQSISDIEELKADISGENFDKKQGKRKKDGIYYTPDTITRYIVEEAIGGWLKDRRTELNEADLPELSDADLVSIRIVASGKNKGKFECNAAIQSHLDFYDAYKEVLSTIKVLDPACGSGAFLNQAFDFLYIEGQRVNKELEQLQPIQSTTFDLNNRLSKQILHNNLFGVDLNQESVEITKLSLWLKTANRYNPLTSLDNNIKCGNSLIDDVTVAGDKAFVWELEFKAVMDNGGFDVVIGNPPYVKEYTHKKAFDGLRASPYYQGKMDLWYLFVCHNLSLLKSKSGILSFIATNNWTTNTGASKLRNKIIEDAKIKQLIDFGSYMIFENADVQSMIMLFSNDKSEDRYTFNYRRIKTKQASFSDVSDLLQGIQTENNEILTPVIVRQNFFNKMLTFSENKIDKLLNKVQGRSNFFLNKKSEVAQGIVLPQDYVNTNSKQFLGNNFHVGQGIFVLSDKEKQALNLESTELELIKPYYTSQQLSRWFGSSNNSEWIIYTDSSFKEADNIKPYPNIEKHLNQFQEVITSDNKPYGLHRARVESFFKGEKIIALRKCVGMPIFTYTDFDCYVSATFYIIKTNRTNQKYLTCLLNSKLIAFWLKNKGKMQGSNYQLDKEPLLAIPIYNPSEEQQLFIKKADIMLEQNKNLQQLQSAFLSFIQADLKPQKLSNKLQRYYELSWDEFKSELKKSKVDLNKTHSLNKVREWQVLFETEKQQALAIKTLIDQTDKEIDNMVYELYGLTAEDIAIIENA